MKVDRQRDYLFAASPAAPVMFECKICGEPFQVGTGTGRRSTSKWCSNRCKCAAARARKHTGAGQKTKAKPTITYKAEFRKLLLDTQRLFIRVAAMMRPDTESNNAMLHLATMAFMVSGKTMAEFAESVDCQEELQERVRALLALQLPEKFDA